MPETSALHPATVGSTFMRQYYHFLAKEPESLHRFYKNESRWCHGVGSQMQEPITGQQAIHGEILRRDYKGARVDLDHGSIDCQGSLQDGVLVLVTGVMTLASSPTPKPFVQTFFLAVQPNGYFVLNDCLRFLELPGTHPADPVVAVKDVKSPPTPQRAIGTPSAAVPASPVKAAASPVAAKPKAVASPAPTKPQASPVKSPAPEKKPVTPVVVASPVAKPVSPVKKAAAEPEKAATPKPSETKPAAPASPAPAKAASPVKQQPAKQQQSVAAPKPVEPAAPKTWAALFTPTPTTPSAAAAAAPAPASAKASPAPKATTTSPPKSAKATTEAAAPAAAPATSTVAAPQPAKEGRPRYFSLYIRDVPPQTKDTDLRELFKAHGTIANVTVPQGRGFAFVDFVEQESMRAALAAGEYKLFDKVIQVDERTERKDKDRSGFRSDTRGGRGRGHGPKGRTGDRKDRDDNKERREREPASSNGPAATNANGPRSTGDRRDKGGRRSNKEEGGRGGNRTQ
ncbi:hypothetical protein P43SY_000795 [Pythium insidiosum]|uniref:Ras GTPase-activating protein-binding protein n=1 Tax=Pythium insidiosum TaxID=114742 RepID=A0AAD5LLW3_PYTIN|nr:hypothetical protein P43SY_000795 [Pythium insidiosum]